jgi:nicotinamide mononucleotide (NMN) deamidase PncC
MSVRSDELARRILAAAKACNLTFATAESCTAGAVAYTKRMKEEMLRVPHDLLRDKSCSCLPRRRC